MEATVVQSEKVQTQPVGWAVRKDQARAGRVDVHRWQKYIDGEGAMWIVTATFGHDNRGRFGAYVELLNVDQEATSDFTRTDFEEMVSKGVLRRITTPILL